MTRETGADDILDAATYSVAELKAMLFKGKGPLTRPLALALLGRKAYPQKIRDLERLLMDEEEVPRLRAMAGQLLGQSDKPSAARALERGLGVKDDLALRGVLQGLELAGGKTVPKSLRHLSRRKGLVGRLAARTAALLGHRLGLQGTTPAAPGAATLRVDPKRAAAIVMQPARGRRVTEALRKLADATPALRLASAGAMTVDCVDHSYLLLFQEDVLHDSLDRLATRRALAAVVAEREELEGDHWAVRYQLLTEPLSTGAIRLRLVTGRGTPVFTGIAKLKGERATFTLRALDRAGGVAIDIRGRYEAGRLGIDHARSDTKRQRALKPRTLEATPRR